MKLKLIFSFLLILASCMSSGRLSIRDFVSDSFQWRTGHDESTAQLIPSTGNNPVGTKGNGTVVHVKFKVKQYGEVSFSIDNQTPVGTEARKVDLSGRRAVRITYQSNHEFMVQLRQTGVHGGVHNHVTLPASKKDTTLQIPFTEFKGGKTPLDLTDVAKFNFAFLSNNKADEYAELKISSFELK